MKIISLCILLISFLLFCNNNVQAATAKEQFTTSLKSAGVGTGHIGANEEAIGFLKNKTLAEAIGSVIKVALSLVGVFFLMLIIYAGYTWMLARGNAPEVEKAKNTIINATIGLVIVLAAYLITTSLSVFAAWFTKV